MSKRGRSCRELTGIAVLPTSIVDGTWSEGDGIEPAGQTGWSVIVVGPAEEITTVAEVHRLEQLGLRPWAPGDKPHWIRIRTTVVSGRRVAAEATRSSFVPPETL